MLFVTVKNPEYNFLFNLVTGGFAGYLGFYTLENWARLGKGHVIMHLLISLFLFLV